MKKVTKTEPKPHKPRLAMLKRNHSRRGVVTNQKGKGCDKQLLLDFGSDKAWVKPVDLDEVPDNVIYMPGHLRKAS